jgi:tRNA threonylcarbamoyladenosine biosynthesis protein TsaB
VSPAPVVLAIDTSGPIARAALVAGEGQVLAAGERSGPRHSATLLPLCHDLLSGRGLGVSELAAIVCGRGPGSFTGLRVGLAVAKGLALAHDRPVLLVSSLHALAQDLATAPGATVGTLLAPCIDAGKGEVYGQLYRLDAPLSCVPAGEELRLRPEDYAERLRQQAAGGPLFTAGTGVDRHPQAFTAVLGAPSVQVGLPGPSAVAVARLALPRLARGERDDLDTAIPSYGRPPDITTPKRG